MFLEGAASSRLVQKDLISKAMRLLTVRRFEAFQTLLLENAQVKDEWQEQVTKQGGSLGGLGFGDRFLGHRNANK